MRRPRPNRRCSDSIAIFVINIDHHPGNSGYGQINWFDPTAAACGEMVYTLIGALGVPLSIEIADPRLPGDPDRHRDPSTTPAFRRTTFDICREAVEAGVDPVLVARNVYDSNNMGG